MSIFSSLKKSSVKVTPAVKTLVSNMRYELIPDSCGAGQFQGGLGIRRVFEFLEDEVLFSAYSDRFRFQPYGFFGGEPARNGKFTVMRGNETISLPARCNYSLKKGDRVAVELGGGGGYGPPEKRSVEAIAKDLREERVTLDFAREKYAYKA